jgi:hypothetical protein
MKPGPTRSILKWVLTGIALCLFAAGTVACLAGLLARSHGVGVFDSTLNGTTLSPLTLNVLWLSTTPLITIPAIVMWRTDWHQAARFTRAWRCEQCGYDLAGLPTKVCPECGSSVPLGPRIPRTDSWLFWSRAIGLTGWFMVGAVMLGIILTAASSGWFALACPGCPVVSAFLSFWPWAVVAKNVRLKGSFADDCFVALWPWIFVAAGIVLGVLSNRP